jgi:hypothetical protein
LRNAYPGDFNGDGKTDFMIFDSSGVRVFLSTGSSFDRQATPWSTAGEYTTMMGDYNGDGKTDFAQFGPSGVRVLYSTGTSFVEQGAVWNPAGDFYTGVYTGDFNGDGYTDFMQYATSEGWRVFIADPADKKFNMSVWTTVGAYPLYMGDFNGDGKTDVMQYGPDYGDYCDPGVRVLISTGTGFSYSKWSPAGVYPTEMGDFNGDGKTDFIQLGHPDGVRVFLADAGKFTMSTGWSGAGTGFPIDSGDFNGDGRSDF